MDVYFKWGTIVTISDTDTEAHKSQHKFCAKYIIIIRKSMKNKYLQTCSK
jgi:hypothetical protein